MVHMPLPSTPLVMFLEIEHCSPRTRARFSKNQSAPKNRRTPQWRTSPCSPRAPIPDGRMERFMHPCFAGVTKFRFLFFQGHPKTHLLLLAQISLGFHYFAGFTFFHALFLASKPILVSFASAILEHFARHQRRVKTPPGPNYAQYAQY